MLPFDAMCRQLYHIIYISLFIMYVYIYIYIIIYIYSIFTSFFCGRIKSREQNIPIISYYHIQSIIKLAFESNTLFTCLLQYYYLLMNPQVYPNCRFHVVPEN